MTILAGVEESQVQAVSKNLLILCKTQRFCGLQEIPVNDRHTSKFLVPVIACNYSGRAKNQIQRSEK